MTNLILFLLLLPSLAHADFVASAGLDGGNFETENSSTSGVPLVKSSTLIGFRGEIEFGSPYITFVGVFNFNRGQARTQYDFNNPSNSSDQAQVEDLKTTVGLSRLSGGMRVKLIKLKNFRLFIGGGVQYGMLNLSYDKADFKDRTNSSTGFEESERQNFKGGFGEVGLEFIVNNNSGFRVQAQRASIQTEKYETIGDEKLKSNFTTFSVSFIEYIETGSW